MRFLRRRMFAHGERDERAISNKRTPPSSRKRNRLGPMPLISELGRLP
jgi:hypothetical protein